MSYHMNSDIGVMNEGNQQFNLHPLFHYPINQVGEQAKLHCLLSPEKLNGFGFSYLRCHFLKPNCPDRADSKESMYS